MSALAARLRTDDGVTLPELMVTIFLLAVVGTIFSAVIGSALNGTRNMEGAARSNDDVRLAIATMDRELRAASQLCVPAQGAAGNELVFETRASAGPTQRVTYRLGAADALGQAPLLRSVDGGPERVVVGTVVNTFVEARDGSAEPLFTNQGVDLSAGPVGSPAFGRVVSIRVWVDTNPRDAISPRVESTEITGRNVWNPNAGCSS